MHVLKLVPTHQTVLHFYISLYSNVLLLDSLFSIPLISVANSPHGLPPCLQGVASNLLPMLVLVLAVSILFLFRIFVPPLVELGFS